MRLLPLLALALAASLAAPAAAGCYRGRPRPVRAASEESWNWTPTPLLDAARLPRQFSWADVRGRSMVREREEARGRRGDARRGERGGAARDNSAPAALIPVDARRRPPPLPLFPPQTDRPLLEPARAPVLRLLLRARHPDPAGGPPQNRKGGPRPRRRPVAPVVPQLRAAQELQRRVRRGRRHRRVRVHEGVRAAGRDLRASRVFLVGWGERGEKRAPVCSLIPPPRQLTYSATDSTKYGKHASACPPAGFCTNCMPVNGADTCWPVKTPILYRVTSYGRVGGKGNGRAANERALVSELYARGPVVCSIATPEDFVYAYRGGVYQDPKNYTKDDVDHGERWEREGGGGSLFFFCLRRFAPLTHALPPSLPSQTSRSSAGARTRTAPRTTCAATAGAASG
jgi:hypothetical protein